MSSTPNFVQSEFRYDEGKSPLALLAETCRNIGVDTRSSKLTKSSIDHVKTSTTSSSSSSLSSSSSVESTSRKNVDSCRLSASPSRNATPVTPTSRTSANSVTGSNATNTTSSNPISTNHNVNISVSTASNHSSSSSSSSSGSYIGNTVTTISNSESNGCSFKPYEDHIISKKKCLDEPRIRSTKGHESDEMKSNHTNNNKPYVNGSATKTHELNGFKRENVKSSSNVPNVTSSSSSSSSSICTSSSSPSTTTSTSTAHANHSSTPSKGFNCNGCLPPHHPPSSTPHHLTLDNVNKYAPYPSLSPYLPPPGYDPASVAAVAAAVAGHCHSPSLCRDPFCAGCRFNSLGQVSSCPAGCTQCSHVSPSMSHQSAAALQANAYLPGNVFYPPPPHHHQHPHHPHHPGNPPTSSSNSLHNPVSPSVAASSVNGNLSKLNICSWVIGSNYCGKRFNTPEELHQHLRNHTSSDPSVSAFAFLGQYPHLDPMLTSPIAGFRRTAFDPVNRYHPYKSLSANGPSLGTLPYLRLNQLPKSIQFP